MLQNGGIYADFTTPINYKRLMKRLENFTGEMWVAEAPEKGSFNFIYVPHNKSALVKEIMD